MLRAVSRSVLASAVLGLLVLTGCHHRGPVPSYPVPEDPPLEETDLAPFLESPGGAEGSPAGDSDAAEPSTDGSVPVE